MSFSIHESIEPKGMVDYFDGMSLCTTTTAERAGLDFYLLGEKIQKPESNHLIDRPRITDILSRSVEQFPATLISGRAGTGKTAIAASFAKGFANVAWFSVETTDMDWPVFAKYFEASLSNTAAGARKDRRKEGSQHEIAQFLITHFSGRDNWKADERRLIVLDDIHNIFDAGWFEDFFNLLIYSLPVNTHLLLLCRSKPPSPLWRLRSKQMLNVVDEKVIAFTPEETAAFFEAKGISADTANEAQRNSFGRVSKLIRFAAE